jgi:hypothetical protein
MSLYHLRLDLLSSLFPSDSYIQISQVFLISLMRAIFPTHVILLDLITPITFGQANYETLRHAVFSSLVSLNFFSLLTSPRDLILRHLALHVWAYVQFYVHIYTYLDGLYIFTGVRINNFTLYALLCGYNACYI